MQNAKQKLMTNHTLDVENLDLDTFAIMALICLGYFD